MWLPRMNFHTALCCRRDWIKLASTGRPLQFQFERLRCRLKKEFQEILAENAAKPEAEQLPLEFFDIDPDLRTMIEKEVQEEEQRVREEMEYELEKQRLLLAKVKGSVLRLFRSQFLTCCSRACEFVLQQGV